MSSLPSQIRLVSTFQELLTAPLANGINALCWERKLPGDFGAVVRALGDGEGIDRLDEARLQALSLDAADNAQMTSVPAPACSATSSCANSGPPSGLSGNSTISAPHSRQGRMFE